MERLPKPGANLRGIPGRVPVPAAPLPRAEGPLAQAPALRRRRRAGKPWGEAGRAGGGGSGSRAGAAPRRSSITCLWRRGPSRGFPERLGEGGLCLGPPRRPGQVRAAFPPRAAPGCRRRDRPEPDKRPGLGRARAGSGSCLVFRFHRSGSPEQPWWGTTPAVVLRWSRAVT